jgi:hypothetical protein
MLHEFGHRIAARWMGGLHEEFLLWPAGGMIPPQVPERPGTMFVAHSGGIVMNLLLAGLCIGGLALMGLMPALGLGGILNALAGAPLAAGAGNFLAAALSLFMAINLGVAFVAILPYYWFDGAPLLESVLWRWLVRRQAINITCIVGMVLAVPMFILSLAGGSFFGMLFWGLLFYTAYARRRQLAYEFADDFESEIARSASYRPEAPARHRRPGRVARWLTQRKVTREQQEQAAVDRILEKVAQHGMHSLTNAEKKTLQRASERLREERRM